MKRIVVVMVVAAVALAAAPALALHDPHDPTGRAGVEQGAVFGLPHSPLDAQGQQPEALVQPVKSSAGSTAVKKNYRWSTEPPDQKALETSGVRGGAR